MVNLAGFELVLIKKEGEEGKVLLRTPVIVGKPFQSTPVFSSTIEYLELNPYWNVPKSIATNELFPKEQKSPGYLRSHHMRILDNGSIPHIRQDPGPWNALGAIKFVFSNPYGVYLHDTPSKSLFEETNRSFSHGCIRMKDPLMLAEDLLGGEELGWDLRRLQEVVNAGNNLKVRLPHPVPIHIVYRTAWVDVDNSIHFRHDIYGRDLRVSRTLF